MRILVTGGGSGLGAALVDALVDAHEVIVLDSNEHPNPRARFVRGSVLDADAVDEATIGCDAVYHLAQLSDLSACQADPERSYEINVVGSRNVFAAAAKADSKVIFLSSAAVYGNAPGPMSEDAQCQPISHFGWHKLQAERMCPPSAFIVRLFNVYGPRCGGMIDSFCRQLVEDKELAIHGTGLQTRDFIYVEDAVRVLLKGLSVNGLYNVGSGKEQSILSVVHMLEQLVGKTAKLRFEPGAAWEVAHSRADISRARRELGWSPTVGLREGLRRTLASLNI